MSAFCHSNMLIWSFSWFPSFLLNVPWWVCSHSERTAGEAITEDWRHPQARRSSIKDDLEGLRRSSNGDNSIICQLQIRQFITWPKFPYLSFVSCFICFLFRGWRSPQSLWSWARCLQHQIWPSAHTYYFACTPPTGPAPPGSVSRSSPSSEVPCHLPKWPSSDYLQVLSLLAGESSQLAYFTRHSDSTAMAHAAKAQIIVSNQLQPPISPEERKNLMMILLKQVKVKLERTFHFPRLGKYSKKSK